MRLEKALNPNTFWEAELWKRGEMNSLKQPIEREGSRY